MSGEPWEMREARAAGLVPVMQALDREGIPNAVVGLGGNIVAVAAKVQGRTVWITPRADYDGGRGFLVHFEDITPDDSHYEWSIRIATSPKGAAALVRRWRTYPDSAPPAGSGRRKASRGRTASRVARRAGRR